MSADFKAIAASEIDEFKREYRARFPGRNVEDLTDEDLLREVMNTVGKPGRLGEHVRCVVSVSMLTEGWDANTVTHVLGVRAFGTQLLCEQVVGRGLRRMSYAVNGRGYFDPEYAEVYGVPFSFIPTAGTAGPVALSRSTRVRALEERAALEITFPRVAGYRYDFGTERLRAEFGQDSKLALSTADVPTWTEAAPIVGETSVHTLDDLKKKRQSEVAFSLAKLTLEKYFRADDGAVDAAGKPTSAAGGVKAWLFPQLLAISKRWLAECLTCKDDTFPQLLLLIEPAHDAADGIYRSIVATTEGAASLVPMLRPFDVTGSTRWVDFDTTKPVFETSPDKCHVSHVVADTGSWEQKLAQTLESMPEVRAYVKNQGLNFTIPYTINGDERQYYPDFLVRLAVDVNLIVEVSGEERKDKAAKVATARTLWIPAVNNHGGFGRWAFVEVTDPWDAKNTIRAALAEAAAEAV
jgi:type III restriction enzyme